MIPHTQDTVLKILKFIEKESKMTVTRSWEEEGNRELVFNTHRDSNQEDKKVLEMDGGNTVQQCECTLFY